MSEAPNAPPVGLPRRLAAILYDGLLLLAIWFVATVPWMAVTGAAVSSRDPLFRLYLTALGLLYFGWFWSHGGQTLGMRTWRITVTGADGAPLSGGQALKRGLAALLSLAPLGLGFWSALLRADRRTWHDRLSSTELRRVG